MSIFIQVRTVLGVLAIAPSAYQRIHPALEAAGLLLP